MSSVAKTIQKKPAAKKRGKRTTKYSAELRKRVSEELELLEQDYYDLYIYVQKIKTALAKRKERYTAIAKLEEEEHANAEGQKNEMKTSFQTFKDEFYEVEWAIRFLER